MTRRTSAVITVLGVVGLAAALILTNDKIESLKAAARGDTFTATCDLNAFVSCSAVIGSSQSEAFGFPNTFLGVVGFSFVVLLGVMLFLQGYAPKLIWFAFLVGLAFAALFITWLQVQSISVIGRLCPYCMVVWAVTIPLVVLGARESARQLAPTSKVATFLSHWTVLVVSLWYVAVAAAVWFTFGDRLWA